MLRQKYDNSAGFEGKNLNVGTFSRLTLPRWTNVLLFEKEDKRPTLKRRNVYRGNVKTSIVKTSIVKTWIYIHNPPSRRYGLDTSFTKEDKRPT